MSETPTSATSPWPVGDDDTSARVRAFDWKATALGPTQHWPERLKGAVEFISGSQVPMSIIWGPERVLIYNDACIAQLGQGHPRAFGRPARESSGEIGAAEAIHRRVFAGEQVTLENLPWTRFGDDDPPEAFFTTYFTSIRDTHGTVAGGLIISFETTDAVKTKQAEAALRESQARLQVAVDLVGLAIYSWDLNADIAYWGERVRAIWGFAPDVKVDRALARSAVHPDDLPAFDAAVSRATDPDGDGVYETQCRVISLADGLERWVSAYGKTTFVAGRAARFVGAVLDITEQKRADARRRESDERFRRFAENSSDVLWILNVEQQRLEYLSPGFLPTWGASPASAIANIGIWNDSIHPEDRVARARSLERVVGKGERTTHRYRIVRPDGSVREIRDTVFPMPDTDGRIGAIGGIAHDISRREALSVYLVDPDSSARDGKSALLRRDGQRVTAFATEAAFLDVAGALAPGCVLVRADDDASASRFDLGRILNSRGIDLPVIFEADLGGDVDLAIGAMKSGAMDVLQAPAEPAAVLAAVASALAHLRQEDLIESAAERIRLQLSRMTAREREVLDGLLAGGTNKTIARKLGISPRTVEVHRARMMERLGVHTAQEAVMAVASAGMQALFPRPEDDG